MKLQAQDVAVEVAAAAHVAGPHEDPAAQNVHPATSAARRVTQHARENARRYRSIKRVDSAVGEDATALRPAHEYFASEHAGEPQRAAGV